MAGRGSRQPGPGGDERTHSVDPPKALGVMVTIKMVMDAVVEEMEASVDAVIEARL